MKGFVKYVDQKTIKNYENNQYFKVVTARAAHKGGSGFGNMFISTPDEVYTNSYISFVTDTEEESKFLLSYLKCKLPNVLLGLRKISQDISEKTCKWIPLVPLDRIWTDNEVNLYFNISSEYISLIDDYIEEYGGGVSNESIPQQQPSSPGITIEFDEISLVYPDGSVKNADIKFMNKFKVTDLKKIAFDNNISLRGVKQTKNNIISTLMTYPQLNII